LDDPVGGPRPMPASFRGLESRKTQYSGTYSSRHTILSLVGIAVMNIAGGANPLARMKPSQPKPSSKDWESKPQAIQVRGSQEWKQWVEDLAAANRQKVAGLVDTALARLARDIGFRIPPER